MMYLRRIFLILCMVLSAFALQAQDTSYQENKKSQLEKEIAQLETMLSQNASKSSNALNELTLIRKQISLRKELISQSDAEIKALNDTIRRTNNQINKLQERYDNMSIYFEKLVRNAYKNRDSRLWYMYILGSSNFSQAFRRYDYLKTLSVRMNEEASQLKELKAQMEQEKQRLSSLRAQAQNVRAGRAKELENLAKQEKKSNNLIAQLNRNKSSYQRQLRDKRKQVEALNKEIEKIIAEYIAQSTKPAKGETKKQSKPIDYKLAGEFEANKGKLPWPVDGSVVEKFGKHNHPVYKNLVMPFNNGIGIAVPKNTEVKAIFDGEVKRVIVMPGYNQCVLVQHGNYFSFYCKLGQVSVKAGDKVKTGQSIGVVDTIDSQTLVHLQVWKEKTPQNPETWLRPR